MEMVSILKILVIGGMGVIGGAISEAAINENHDVHILSRRAPFEKWVGKKATFIQGDWKDDSFAKDVLSRGYNIIVDTQVFNQKQLKRSMDLCNGHCTQYIYISTDSVYIHPAENVCEDDEIDIRAVKWSYGLDKRLAELDLIATSNSYDFYWTTIRPTITFGETRIPVGFASKRRSYTMIERLLRGKPIIRFDDPNTPHALCHSSTFGQATTGLFLNPAASNQFYHISDNKSYTYSEIFNAIESILGVRGNYIFVSSIKVKKLNKTIYEEMIYDKNPAFTLDNSKIKKVSPNANYEVNIKQVIGEILEYLQSVRNEITEDKEYDLISDAVIVESLDSIKDEDEKMIAISYVNSLSKEYRNELKKFVSERQLKYKIDVVKDILRPIKKFLKKEK